MVSRTPVGAAAHHIDGNNTRAQVRLQGSRCSGSPHTAGASMPAVQPAASANSYKTRSRAPRHLVCPSICGLTAPSTSRPPAYAATCLRGSSNSLLHDDDHAPAGDGCGGSPWPPGRSAARARHRPRTSTLCAPRAEGPGRHNISGNGARLAPAEVLMPGLVERRTCAYTCAGRGPANTSRAAWPAYALVSEARDRTSGRSR